MVAEVRAASSVAPHCANNVAFDSQWLRALSIMEALQPMSVGMTRVRPLIDAMASS